MLVGLSVYLPFCLLVCLCTFLSVCLSVCLCCLSPCPPLSPVSPTPSSFFKSIVVRRIYDKEANNVVYVSFSSKLDANSDGNKSRFKSSLCALHVE